MKWQHKKKCCNNNFWSTRTRRTDENGDEKEGECLYCLSGGKVHRACLRLDSCTSRRSMLASHAAWIVAAGQRVLGCAAARALASLLAERIVGLDLAEASTIDWRALEELAGGLPRLQRHAAHLAADGLAAALSGR